MLRCGKQGATSSSIVATSIEMNDLSASTAGATGSHSPGHSLSKDKILFHIYCLAGAPCLDFQTWEA